VGIGTLIVFIAMVLVAAIAAGVLINTAGFLQTQAEATGEDSTALVSERINVNSEVGIVASGADTLNELRIAVTGAPGADQIDLAETTLQVVGPGGQENLVFTDGTLTALDIGPVDNTSVGPNGEFDVTIGNIDRLESIDTTADEQQLVVTVNDTEGGAPRDTATITNGSVVNDGAQTINVSQGTSDGDKLNLSTGGLEADDEIVVQLYNNSTSTDAQYLVAEVSIVANNTETNTTEVAFATTASDLTANEFAVVPTDGGSFESEPVLSENDDYTLVANPDAGAFEDGTAFGQGDDATIDIVSPAGATTRIELNAPDLFSEVGEAVLL